MSIRPTRPRGGGAGAGRLQTVLSTGYEARSSRRGSPEPTWGEIFQLGNYDEKTRMLNRLLTMTFFQKGLLVNAVAAHLRAKMYYDDTNVLKFSFSKAVGSIEPGAEPEQTFCTRTFTCEGADPLVCIAADKGSVPDDCEGPPLSAERAQPFFTRALEVWEEYRLQSEH